MKHMKSLLLLTLMLLTLSCQQTTRYQEIEKLGREKMKYIEKEGFPHIEKMIVNNLKYPETYEPINTDMSIVTSEMIIYDSDAFLDLRNLYDALEDFNENFGNDSTSQEARNALQLIQDKRDALNKIREKISHRPLEFEGIDVYHQFYADDVPGHKSKQGYHIIFHKDNRTTLLCDHDEFMRLKAFAKELLKDTPYGID